MKEKNIEGTVESRVCFQDPLQWRLMGKLAA